MSPLTELLSEEVRLARAALGLSQDELARQVNYSLSWVAMVETGRRLPREETIPELERVLKLDDGRLGRIREKIIKQNVVPELAQNWSAVEQEATSLRWYELSHIPSLLQTEEYARAVLRFIDEPDERIETQVAALMVHQQILDREHPPELVVLLDEGVLRRPVGGPEVMARQLRKLADHAEHMIIQVVPFTAETYHGLAGQFVIAA
jgi:transcriptional regulator with XRE-family HTH domain